MSYGDWAQWNRRYDKEYDAGRGLLGVNCPHVEGADWLCADCAALAREWMNLHDLEPPHESVESADECARKVAGL